MLVLTATVISNPAVLILGLSLLIYLSFYAHRRGAPDLATLLPQISAVSLPIVAVLSPEGAGAFAATLVMAGIVALITVWAAHAAFPSPVAMAVDEAPAASATRPVVPAMAARHALLDALVLLPLLTWYILDATTVAVVVLIVIVTLLRQHDREQGRGAALGLILGNLIGGIAAAIVYNLVLMSNTLLFFITVCLAASLMFAGRIAAAGDRAPIYAVAFATFILLLGLGMTPLPGGSGEAFVSRLLNVVVASAYAIGGLSLVERWRVSSLHEA
ncbi:MAG: FUSC family protein [Solimonas sp.]